MVDKKKKVGFFKRVFCDLFEVTISLKTGESRTFRLSEIKKLDQNLLKGIDEDGHKVELKTEEKFDYFVKKLY